MLRSDDEWLALADAFYTASLGDDWYSALEALALATGSRAGELIGVGSDKSIPFNVVTDLGEDWRQDFIAIGGGDPSVNPFVRNGGRAPELHVLQSAEFITPEERRKSRFMVEFASRHDMAHICLSPLVKNDGGLVGLAVLRSTSQGEIDAKQREVFTTIAPHVRAAVRMQMALEHQGAELMAGALETVGQAVFICDRLGQVRAMTAKAESIVGVGKSLKLRRGVLTALSRSETAALHIAIAKAVRGSTVSEAPSVSTLAVRGVDNGCVVLEVMPLPRREHTFGFEPRALVVCNQRRDCGDQIQSLLQSIHGLTTAEATVALMLAEGCSPERISAMRNTSLATVRTQIRAIYSKTGIHRQNELANLVATLRSG